VPYYHIDINYGIKDNTLLVENASHTFTVYTIFYTHYTLLLYHISGKMNTGAPGADDDFKPEPTDVTIPLPACSFPVRSLFCFPGQSKNPTGLFPDGVGCTVAYPNGYPWQVAPLHCLFPFHRFILSRFLFRFVFQLIPESAVCFQLIPYVNPVVCCGVGSV
jgi:hypothetical protein